MTHCERILALLSDGRWHDHHEIYGLSCVGHSRIAELRRKGHQIEMRRQGGLYLYRLLTEREVRGETAPKSGSVGPNVARSSVGSGPSQAEQHPSSRSVSVPVQLPLLPEQRGAYWENAA